MTRESYETITGILRGHPRRIRLVCLLNHTMTGFIFVLYPAFLRSEERRVGQECDRKSVV